MTHEQQTGAGTLGGGDAGVAGIILFAQVDQINLEATDLDANDKAVVFCHWPRGKLHLGFHASTFCYWIPELLCEGTCVVPLRWLGYYDRDWGGYIVLWIMGYPGDKPARWTG